MGAPERAVGLHAGGRLLFSHGAVLVVIGGSCLEFFLNSLLSTLHKLVFSPSNKLINLPFLTAPFISPFFPIMSSPAASSGFAHPMIYHFYSACSYLNRELSDPP